MSGFKFTFDGIPFEADTATGAAELFHALKNAGVRPAMESAAPKKPVTKRAKTTRIATVTLLDSAFPDWVPEAAFKFLSAIRDAGQSGADSETMMKALGIDQPKALGGRSAIINRFIESTGHTQAQVYDNKRTSAGRFWKPRKHLGDVIDVISDGLAAEHERE